MKFILTLFAISTLLITGSFVMAHLQLSPNNAVILHFDTTGQPDSTGTQREVLLMIATGAILMLINLFLARVLYQREHVAAVLIANINLLIAALLFIATFVIISNNK